MRRVLSFVLAVILSVSMLVSFTGCNGSNKEIEYLITEFENACNALDFDAVLNCINPKVSDNIKIAVGLVGMFTDTDTDEMFEKLADYLSDGDIGGTDFFSSIKIEIKDINVEEDAALVDTVISYSLNGDDYQREATFNCIYYAEKWYISSFSFK